MQVSKIVSLASHLLVIFVTIVGFAAASPRDTGQPKRLDSPSASVPTEPAFAAKYLAAYARGDEVTADQVASPLYRAQWSRLGLAPADRQALRPASRRSGMPEEWLHFDYVGGAVDWRGFGHLLYQARSTDPGHPSPPSAWRLDTEPFGRVIWAEMVFLFSPEVTAVTPVVREGYYAVVVPPAGADAFPAAAAGSIAFFAIDAEGQTRPGAWTYGQTSNRPSEYGRRPIPPVVTLDPESAWLERSYLQALW